MNYWPFSAGEVYLTGHLQRLLTNCTRYNDNRHTRDELHNSPCHPHKLVRGFQPHPYASTASVDEQIPVKCLFQSLFTTPGKIPWIGLLKHTVQSAGDPGC